MSKPHAGTSREKILHGRNSAQLNDQARHDGAECEHSHRDRGDLQPVGAPRLGGLAVHPFLPAPLVTGTRAMVMTHAAVETGGFITMGRMFHGRCGSRERIANFNRHGKQSLRKVLQKSAFPPERKDALKINRSLRSRCASLLVMDLRSRGLCRADFLELGQGTQAGWFGLTRAAAGGGEHCENENDECGNNTDHGVGRFCLEILKNARMGKRVFNPEAPLFRRCHIARLAGCGSGARAAGGGEKCGGGGDQGDFHLWVGVVGGS